MKKAPVHILAIAAILGILTTTTRWWLCLFIIFYFILNRRRLPISSIMIISLFYLTFLFYTPLYESHHSTNISPDVNSLTGTIISTPVIDGDRLSFHFKLPNEESVLVQHRINSKEDQTKLKALYYGVQCTMSGQLEEPSVQRNFYAFNYRAYLRNTFNIHWIYRTDELLLNNCEEGRGWRSALFLYRQQSISAIKTDFPEELAGMMNTLIFGDRSGASEELEERYQKLGLIHLLAVSGLHVGTILGLLYLLLIRIGVIRETALLVLLALIPVIILFTGGAPSVIRAGLMAAFVCIVALSRVKVSTFNQLCLILLVLLFYQPTMVYHIGFQLSFLITAALILSSKMILRDLSSFKQLLYGSCIAQLASIPIVIWNFYEFSIWSLPLNMIFIPLMTVIILPGILLTYFLYLFVPIPIWTILSQGLSVLFTSIHSVMEWTDRLPFGTIILGKPSSIMMMLLLLSIYLLLISWEKEGDPKRLMRPVLLCSLVIFVQLFYPKLNDSAYITVLDVGQGDAIVIELPYREAVYVIDTGGRINFQREDWMKRKREFDTGKDIVAAFLKARGIWKIDALILSHGDFDHSGGTGGILAEVEVEQVVYGYSDAYEPAEEKLLNQIQQASVPIRFLMEGDSWNVGDDSFLVLNSGEKSDETRNNRSIVLYSRIHGQSFLFLGDVDKSVERRILKSYPFLKVNYLKVGHHGSKTSTSEFFLKSIEPDHALISVGKNNRFRHPSPSVIKSLNQNGTNVYRTDMDGAIMVIITPDGQRIKTRLVIEDNTIKEQ